MENFVAHNPVKLHFGRGILKDLGSTLRKHGSKVLLMYGKGSIKQNGIYDTVTGEIKEGNQ